MFWIFSVKIFTFALILFLKCDVLNNNLILALDKQFSCSVVLDSLQPQGPQHARPPYPSPTPGGCSNSCPLSQWCHPAISSPVVPFSSCLQSFRIRVFSSESVFCIRWPKYWRFSFSISPSSEHSGLISFRMDWFDLLAVQGILKGLLQHHSWKVSVLQCSTFTIVQLSHAYVTTGKTTALTRQTFVGKVISLSFNMLSRFVIAFLPGSKCLLIMATVITGSDFGAPQNSLSLFQLFPLHLPWSDATRRHDLSFLNVEF